MIGIFNMLKEDGMDPFIISALVKGGTSLVGGLLSQAAQQEEDRKKRIFQAQQDFFKEQAGNAQELGRTQQNAYAQMLQAYQNSLR